MSTIIRLGVSKAEFERALDQCWPEVADAVSKALSGGWRSSVAFKPAGSGSQATDLILHIGNNADPLSLVAGALITKYVVPFVNRFLGGNAVEVQVDATENKSRPTRKKKPRKTPTKQKRAPKKRKT